MAARLIHRVAGAVSMMLALSAATSARAGVELWISDENDNIASVDVATGVVSNLKSTGQDLTDIAFVGSALYGVTFLNLYSIDKATGATTAIGPIFPGGSPINALVGDAARLLAASDVTNEVYSIDPATGVPVDYAPSRGPAAGDLAFVGETLYESAVARSGDNELIDVSTDSIVGLFHTTTTPSFSGVFGLADDGTTLYAVDGTEIYSVDPTTALLTPLVNYAGQGLSDATGAAFIAENINPVPEPSTWAMIAIGFGGLAYAACRQRRKPAAA